VASPSRAALHYSRNMHALRRAARASLRAASSQRHVLSAVGGAGLCISTVAVHRQMAGGRMSFCSGASSARRTTAAASGEGEGA
ncbi:unnamed protein product, partial [Laminaria digitata]